MRDFNAGRDMIIEGGLKFSDLNIRQSGDDTVINDTSDAIEIVLQDFQASQLASDDFDFTA